MHLRLSLFANLGKDEKLTLKFPNAKINLSFWNFYQNVKEKSKSILKRISFSRKSGNDDA
jgi:hypothetical protein